MPHNSGFNLVIPNVIDGHFVDAVSGAAFSNCETRFVNEFDEEEVVVPNEDLYTVRFADGIKSIGPAIFEYCTRLRRVDLPKGLEEIGQSTFEGCSDLQDIEIPETVKKIDAHAFKKSGIQTLIIPGSVETIGWLSLAGTNCVNIILSEGTKKIDSEALVMNSKLRSIVFPRSLVSIDENSFIPCDIKDDWDRKWYSQFFEPSNITVFCYPGTAGFVFAKMHGMKVENAGF